MVGLLHRIQIPALDRLWIFSNSCQRAVLFITLVAVLVMLSDDGERTGVGEFKFVE